MQDEDEDEDDLKQGKQQVEETREADEDDNLKSVGVFAMVSNELI
jgi:hypothetical protein